MDAPQETSVPERTKTKHLNVSNLPHKHRCKRQRHMSTKRAADSRVRFWACAVLGNGSYGKVFECWDAQERCHVAVKQFTINNGNEDGMPQAGIREMAILRRCTHRNIMPIIDTLFDDHHRDYFGADRFVGGFVMPLCVGGDLAVWSRKNPPHTVALQKRVSLARQLFSAVCYLHQRSIVHRDIKPHNCMLNKDGTHLLLGDLGLGRQCTVPLSPTYSGAVCTLWYRPPELLLGSRSYGFGLDIWSTGVTVAELFRDAPLFPGDDDFGQLLDIFHVLGTPNEDVWRGVSALPEYNSDAFPQFLRKDMLKMLPHATPDIVNLIESTLCYVPIERISAKKALQHAALAAQHNDMLVDGGTKEEEGEKKQQSQPRRKRVCVSKRFIF